MTIFLKCYFLFFSPPTPSLQMTPQNLAVCFAPTLFSLSSSLRAKTSNSLSRKGSFRRNAVQPTLTPEQVASNKEISESVVSEGGRGRRREEDDKGRGGGE